MPSRGSASAYGCTLLSRWLTHEYAAWTTLEWSSGALAIAETVLYFGPQ